MKHVLILILMMIIFSCEEEHFESRDYPVVITKVSEISANGATFKMEFISQPDEILEKGFLWIGTNVSGFTYKGVIEDETFTYTLFDETPTTKQHLVRAYIITPDRTVYGNWETFYLKNSGN